TLDIADGDWTALWDSGLAIGLWVVAIVGLVLPVIVGPILRRRMQAAAGHGNQTD
ncbi:tripartite tricarboxylate transporter permease, partial [Halomonas sp. FL8]|nr:tripartite tricarboxylate transporter permease [Halomonas sp. FL8]